MYNPNQAKNIIWGVHYGGNQVLDIKRTRGQCTAALKRYSRFNGKTKCYDINPNYNIFYFNGVKWIKVPIKRSYTGKESILPKDFKEEFITPPYEEFIIQLKNNHNHKGICRKYKNSYDIDWFDGTCIRDLEDLGSDIEIL